MRQYVYEATEEYCEVEDRRHNRLIWPAREQVLPGEAEGIRQPELAEGASSENRRM